MNLNKSMQRIKNHPYKAFLILIAAVALFTPFYGIGYIILISLSIKYLGFIKSLQSLIGRSILGLLLFVAAIMITGLIAWTMHYPLYPVMAALVFIGFIYTLAKTSSGAQASPPIKIINQGDVIAVALALVAPLIIMISFFALHPSYASVYQFLTNGWDNGSHLVMLETASIEKAYIYGPDAEVLPKTINHAGAYPQAWHLSTSTIANGFGTNLFNPHQPLQAMVAYAAVTMVWYFLAVFLFSRIAWGLLETRLSKKQSLFVAIFAFSLANLLIQLAAFWGSLTVGFANYIGCMALLTAMIGSILEGREKTTASYILSLILGTATVLSWFLPLPAIALMIIGAYWVPKKSLLNLVKPSLKPAYIATVLAVAAVLFQVGIFVVFSEVSGEAQLNNGHLSGAFAGGELLLLITSATALVYWFTRPLRNYNFINKGITIIGAILLLVGALYAYQLLTSGEVSYYFGKAMRLALVVTGIFFSAAFAGFMTEFIDKKRLHTIGALALSIGFISLILIASNQSLLGFKKLFQQNSLVRYSTATAVVHYLATENPNNAKLVILRHKSNLEDYNSKLDAKVAHLPYICTYDVVTSKNSSDLQQKIKSLDECATKLPKKIIVITSDLTKNAVAALQRKNIEIVNVP